MLDKLDTRDMKDRQDKDTMDKLEQMGSMEWLGSPGNWVSMVLMDLVADIPVVDCHYHHQSLQHHHLDVHWL